MVVHTSIAVAGDVDARVMFGISTVEISQKGVETFGSGNFGASRIGYHSLEKWPTLFPPPATASE